MCKYGDIGCHFHCWKRDINGNYEPYRQTGWLRARGTDVRIAGEKLQDLIEQKYVIGQGPGFCLPDGQSIHEPMHQPMDLPNDFYFTISKAYISQHLQPDFIEFAIDFTDGQVTTLVLPPRTRGGHLPSMTKTIFSTPMVSLLSYFEASLLHPLKHVSRIEVPSDYWDRARLLYLGKASLCLKVLRKEDDPQIPIVSPGSVLHADERAIIAKRSNNTLVCDRATNWTFSIPHNKSNNKNEDADEVDSFSVLTIYTALFAAASVAYGG